jgi:hypothetical protein
VIAGVLIGYTVKLTGVVLPAENPATIYFILLQIIFL